MFLRSLRIPRGSSLNTLPRLLTTSVQHSAPQTIEGQCPAQSSEPSKGRKLTFTESEFKAAKPFSEIPGPSGLEFLVNVLLPWGKYHGKDMVQIFTTMQRQYGNFVRFPGLFGMSSVYIACDPNELEVIFRNEGPTPFRMTLQLVDIFREKERPDLFGDYRGLIQDQGETWQWTRTKVNPIMMQPKTVKMYVGAVDKISSEFVERIRSIRDAKGEMPKDFHNELNKWALESIAFIALNQRLGLVGPTDRNSSGQQMIEAVQVFLDLSFKMEFLPSMWRFVETSDYRKMMKALHTVTDIITSYIDKAMKDFEKNPVAPGNEESVLQKLLKIDKKMAIVMALDMLMAGVDTTSNTMSFLIYALATNPEKQALLRKEVMTICPDKDTPLTEQAMKNMPYLRACRKESLRLRGTVIGTGRRLPVDTVISGYQVPQGTDVVMGQTLISTTEKYFSRPLEFIPERFLKDGDTEPELKSQHPFAFLPFGFGSRMCVGRRLAELEMEILLIRLIRNFEIRWEYPELGVKTQMLNSLDGPLRFKMIDV